jgi:hypothetical protein
LARGLSNDHTFLLDALARLAGLGIVSVLGASPWVGAAWSRGYTLGIGGWLEFGSFRESRIPQWNCAHELRSGLRGWGNGSGQSGSAGSSLVLDASAIAAVGKGQQHGRDYADHGATGAATDANGPLRLGVKIQTTWGVDWLNWRLVILWAHG